MNSDPNTLFNVAHVRSSTNPSFLCNTSNSEIDVDNFSEICRNNLKVSPKNQILWIRLKGITSQLSFTNIELIEEKAQQQLKKKSSLNEVAQTEESPKFDLSSSLTLFLVKETDLQSLIPDHEIFACKEIFVNSTCHESYFGLARLLAYQGQFDSALEYLKLAVETYKDPLYAQWFTTVSAKLAKKTETEVNEKGIFSSFLCFNVSRNKSSVEDFIDLGVKTVENLWAAMEIGFKGLEAHEPEYFASRIIEVDKYFGYLAWSDVYFFRNEWQKGLDVLKQLVLSHQKRPEAYLKLWYHYYFNVKDFEQAEFLISEAFLMINLQDYHEYYILLSIYSAKTLFKLKRTNECLSMLQKKYLENPTYPVFLFEYGKYCVKSEDYNFNGTAIGALQECTRQCDPSRLGLIYYWLSKGYMQGRQHIEAFETVKLALSHLSPKYARKTSELKMWIIDIQPSIEKVEKIEKILSGNLNIEGFKLCKTLCSQVKDLHKITVDVLLAKMLWKTGRHDEALKKLYAVSGISTVKMNAHFLLLEYLSLQNNLRCMKTVASEMVGKCKNPQVPTHIWVKVNIMYAGILLKNGKPGKAILILKLLAKVLPPIPFAYIPYAKFLQRAKDLQDLASAHLRDSDSVNTYNFSSYKNSFMESGFEVRDISHKIIAEESTPFPPIALKFAERRSQRMATERAANQKTYFKKKTVDEKGAEVEEKKDFQLKEVNYLSVCSDPVFLYKIGKISSRHNVMLHDGLWAIRDYIELLRFEKDRNKACTQAQKAERIYKDICMKIKES